MKQLENRVAVITGGASGIGRGMAHAFAREGMKLVIGDVERSALDEAVALHEAQGTEVVGVECDVSSADSVANLARQTLDAFGAVHVLCNNAGVSGSSTGHAIWEASADEWDWVMGVNLMGVVHCNRSFVPIMIEQDTEGHIVSTASIAGLIPGAGVYGITKHAVVALSECLWNDLRDRGTKLKASVLCPGWVNTRIMQSERNRPEAPREALNEQSAARGEMMRKTVEGLIQAGLDPAEVGRMVVDAVKRERFYILTHPWNEMIEQRVENVLQDRDPIGIAPADGEWLPSNE